MVLYIQSNSFLESKGKLMEIYKMDNPLQWGIVYPFYFQERCILYFDKYNSFENPPFN